MKTLFLEARYNGKVDLNKIKINQLPEKVGLVSTVQFADYLDEIKNFLAKKNKKFFIGKGKQKYTGQVLGCDVSSAISIKNKVDAFLYIGDGKFHPIKVALETGKAVFTFNPLNNDFKRSDSNDIENYKKRKKGALIKFLSAESVGILISTKRGQYYPLDKLDLVIKKLNTKYTNKKFYTFIAETIDYNQLENFPFIEAWVNTACPRIEEDLSMVNIEDLSVFYI